MGSIQMAEIGKSKHGIMIHALDKGAGKGAG